MIKQSQRHLLGRKNNIPDKEKTITYQLRDIPKSLWDRAKHRAVDEGIPLRTLVLESVEKALDNK